MKELQEAIKNKSEELIKLQEIKADDDIEIKKLKRDIELLKIQLEAALNDNISLTEKMDVLINMVKENQEEIKQYKQEIDKKDEDIKFCKEQMTKCFEKMNEVLTVQDILTNKLLKVEKDREKTKAETKQIKKELKEIPEILLIFISEEDDKQLYISRIKKDSESRVIKKLKAVKYKVFNKFQTYNSVIKYNEVIKEYKEPGLISTKRNYISLENIILDDFIEKIKETI